jgi:hypothetical protein
MEYLNVCNTLFQNILTQSSRRRGEEPKVERNVITKLCIYLWFLVYLFFLIFITKINMKEESGFLITYNPLRLCVKNYGVKN